MLGFPLADPIIGIVIFAATIILFWKPSEASDGDSWTASSRNSSTDPAKHSTTPSESSPFSGSSSAGSDTGFKKQQPSMSLTPHVTDAPLSVVEKTLGLG